MKRFFMQEPADQENHRHVEDHLGPRSTVEYVSFEGDDGYYHLLVTDRGEVFSAWSRWQMDGTGRWCPT